MTMLHVVTDGIKMIKILYSGKVNLTSDSPNETIQIKGSAHRIFKNLYIAKIAV